MRARLPHAALLAAALGGCKVGPEYAGPPEVVPAAFAHGEPEGDQPSRLAEWWAVFGDRRLDTLIVEAAASNHDVRIAAARVREARALRGAAAAELGPQVDAVGLLARSRQSAASLAGAQLVASGASLESDQYSVGPVASWELDVFGGVRRQVEAAQADLDVVVEDGHGVLVSVLAEVGLTYVDLRGSQRRAAVARDNLAVQEETAELTRDLARAGLADEFDAARAEAQAERTRAGVPPLEEAERRALHRLAVLLGRPPEELESDLAEPAPIPAAAPRVPIGLPSDLLRRRPDLRAAERRLAAATARVGVATADLFPHFTLTGAAALSSTSSGDLLETGSRFWSLGSSLRWPIFHAGALRRNLEASDARAQQALLRYEQVVLVALEEVENALVAFGREQDRHSALVASEDAARRAARLANDQYRSGLIDFLDVLAAESALLEAQDDVARSDQALSRDLVRLYAALGGGWTAADGS